MTLMSRCTCYLLILRLGLSDRINSFGPPCSRPSSRQDSTSRRVAPLRSCKNKSADGCFLACDL
ncbi:hypothetical protein C8Q80DRAFT_1208813 [Daedaleopsis nitida]|nr:hypothetical protein C8Q80DRAFT_1208813 [Daedaleopsis nitida]